MWFNFVVLLESSHRSTDSDHSLYKVILSEAETECRPRGCRLRWCRLLGLSTVGVSLACRPWVSPWLVVPATVISLIGLSSRDCRLRDLSFPSLPSHRLVVPVAIVSLVCHPRSCCPIGLSSPWLSSPWLVVPVVVVYLACRPRGCRLPGVSFARVSSTWLSSPWLVVHMCVIPVAVVSLACRSHGCRPRVCHILGLSFTLVSSPWLSSPWLVFPVTVVSLACRPRCCRILSLSPCPVVSVACRPVVSLACRSRDCRPIGLLFRWLSSPWRDVAVTVVPLACCSAGCRLLGVSFPWLSSLWLVVSLACRLIGLSFQWLSSHWHVVPVAVVSLACRSRGCRLLGFNCRLPCWSSHWLIVPVTVVPLACCSGGCRLLGLSFPWLLSPWLIVIVTVEKTERSIGFTLCLRYLWFCFYSIIFNLDNAVAAFAIRIVSPFCFAALLNRYTQIHWLVQVLDHRAPPPVFFVTPVVFNLNIADLHPILSAVFI